MIDEEEKKPKWSNTALQAIGVMALVAGLAFMATKFEKAGLLSSPYPASTEQRHQIADTVRLTFDRAVSYKIVNTPDSSYIDFNTPSPCKIVKSELVYYSESGLVTFQFENRELMNYQLKNVTLIDIGGVEKCRCKATLINAHGNTLAMTRVNQDSVLVIVEQPYFIILSKGNRCITAEDLPPIEEVTDN